MRKVVHGKNVYLPITSTCSHMWNNCVLDFSVKLFFLTLKSLGHLLNLIRLFIPLVFFSSVYHSCQLNFCRFWFCVWWRGCYSRLFLSWVLVFFIFCLNFSPKFFFFCSRILLFVPTNPTIFFELLRDHIVFDRNIHTVFCPDRSNLVVLIISISGSV